MKLLYLFSLMLFVSHAQANVWDGSIDMTQRYSCIGVDGIPIGLSGPLKDACCSNGSLIANPPPTCRAGFNSITTDSGNGAAGGINLAQHQLEVSSGMDGNSMEDNTTPPNLGGTNSGGPGGESVAAVEGSGGTSGSTNPNANLAGGSGGGKPGGVGSFGSGSGGGLSLGSVGGTKRGGESDDPNNQKASGVGYVKAGDGSKGKDGSGGMFGGMFGGSGAGAGAGGADGKSGDLSFGNGSDGAGGANAANGSGGEDGDGVGTAEDPSDYFNRIDKSASIFKIVSARYMKKKSLWMIPQKLPEDLKEKRI